MYGITDDFNGKVDEDNNVDENKNMKLWLKVCETNPEITKRVNQRGGFTAIDSQTQIKRATELWGSYGNMWGLKEVDIQFVHDSTNNPVALYIYGTFMYPLYPNKDKLLEGGNIVSFPIAADMPYKPNDDCIKKLQTECISKALSRLGFNSDVFEGKFDDNRYVAEMKKKYADKPVVVTPVDKPTDSVDKQTQENRVLRLIYDKLMETANKGFVVDMALLKKEIITTFGVLPVSENSVSKVIDGIADAVSIGTIYKNNDFPGKDIKGLDDD